MFAEWVAHGAEIGTVAFFALAVFLMFCAAFAAVLVVGIMILGGKDDEDEKYNGPRSV